MASKEPIATILRAAQANQPQKVGFFRSVFNRHIAQPVMLLTGGLSVLGQNTRKTLSLWGNYRTKGRIEQRVDIRHVLRNKRDIVRSLPCLLYFVAPFAIFTFPRLLNSMPESLPSVFLTDELLQKRVTNIRNKREALRDELLNQLSERIHTISQSTPTTREEKEIVAAARYWARWMKQYEKESIKMIGGDALDVMPLFTGPHGIRLGNLSYREARLWASYMGLAYPFFFPQVRLFRNMDWILKDDELIRREGIASLSKFEVIEALEERGFSKQLTATPTYGRDALNHHQRLVSRVFDLLEKRKPVELRDHLTGRDISIFGSIILVQRLFGK